MGPSGLLEGANKKQNEVEKSQNKDDARIENLEDELAKLEPIDYSINPVITVSDGSGSEGTATKTKNITISVMDKGSSGLSSSNSYQYFLSSSGTSLTGGSWTTYTNGKSFTVGSGKNGAYYLFVKRVKSNDGGESQKNGTAITVSGTTYQRFGPYYFDNTVQIINPVITVSDSPGSAGTATKNITISVKDEGSSGLSSSNSYQYFLSSSGTSLTGGSWTTYTNGKSFTVGSGKNGAYYLFVKRVKSNDGGESQKNGTAITVSGTTYQRFGPYNFDSTGPTIAVTPTQSSTWGQSVEITITASDTGGGLSSSNSYQYVLSPSSSSITNGKVFNYNSGVTQTISAQGVGNYYTYYYYIYVKQISDTAGNKSTSNGDDTALSGYHKFGPYTLRYR